MKKCRIGILLLTLAITLLNVTLVGCVGRNRDDETTTTTTDSGSPLLPSPDATLPGEGGESQTDSTDESTLPQESESMTDSETTTKQDATTTTAKETTTAKDETTTKKPETTTTKAETTTTKKPETTTTKKQETTTKQPETTTTTKQETTTTKAETTTTKSETTTASNESASSTSQTTTIVTPGMTTGQNSPSAPSESITLPLPTPGESTTSNTTSGTTSGTTTSNSASGTTSGTTTSNSASGTTTSGTTTSGPTGEATTVPEISAGEWLHFEAFDDDHMGAGAFLGRSARELPVTDIIEHFDLPLTAQDITVIDNGDSEDSDGDEWYLILPRYRDTVVRLHEAETSNGTTTAGELIAEGMHPMLIRCDPEDGEPSVFVELIHGEERITFSLRVDKESGKATFHNSILNITPDQSARRR